MELLQDLFSLIGRVLISGMFLWGAYEKVTHWHSTVAYMRSKNVPQLSILLPASIGLKILGGLLILFGWHAHIGAVLLLLVTIPSVVTLHAFWRVQGNEKIVEKAIFMKETAIIGGILLILALGAGHFGLGHGG